MNIWTQLSVEFANQRNYLDELFVVYPTIPDGIREIDQDVWGVVVERFAMEANTENNAMLLRALLRLKLFPIKDSYVAYLKKDQSAIERNPNTVNRICGRIREMGVAKVYERCSEPKETNRQIGPMFRRWIERGTIAPVVSAAEFKSSQENCILSGSDAFLKTYALTHFNYTRDKGLDFIGKFNGQYILGEAKFLTDFGGHQNSQFADGIFSINTENVTAKIIAIYDGVCYIRGRGKLYKFLNENPDKTILSALVLREYLHSLDA